VVGDGEFHTADVLRDGLPAIVLLRYMVPHRPDATERIDAPQPTARSGPP
jgi:hypothetical protein